MKAWKSPIRILLVFLIVLSVWASFNWDGLNPLFWLNQLFHFFLLIVPGFAIYQLTLRLKLIKPTRWEHRLITSLILFLLFDPIFPWWVFLTLGLITEPLQRWLRVPTGPIINPAALAAIVLSLVGQFPTWWGTNFSPRLDIIPGGMSAVMFLTVPIAGYVAYKYRKLQIVATALVAFAVAYLLVVRSNPLGIMFEGTFVFFLLVMAIEPKTSPALQKQQWLYGALLGLLVVLFIEAGLLGIWIEPYAGALVVINLFFSLYRNKTVLLAKFKKPPTQPTVPTPVPVVQSSAQTPLA